MNASFKPEGYNSLSPYLVINNAQKLADLLKTIFNAKEMRKYERPDKTISHMELKIDDTIIMMSDSTEAFPATTTIMHVYVQDVFKTFDMAISNGCTATEKPVTRANDPDTRGSFMDFAAFTFDHALS